MPIFIVKYEGDYTITSKVYAIDTVRDRFLIVDIWDNFVWVDTRNCEFVKED